MNLRSNCNRFFADFTSTRPLEHNKKCIKIHFWEVTENHGLKVARYSFHSLCARAVARSLGCKAYIVFAGAVAKSGFCKFIGNFLAPVSPLSFGEFF